MIVLKNGVHYNMIVILPEVYYSKRVTVLLVVSEWKSERCLGGRYTV